MPSLGNYTAIGKVQRGGLEGFIAAYLSHVIAVTVPVTSAMVRYLVDIGKESRPLER